MFYLSFIKSSFDTDFLDSYIFIGNQLRSVTDISSVMYTQTQGG